MSERVTILAVACGHPADAIRVIDNAVHEDVEQGARNTPLLLWCATCGALAWTDGSLVAVVGLGRVERDATGCLRVRPGIPPGPSAWLPPYVHAKR